MKIHKLEAATLLAGALGIVSCARPSEIASQKISRIVDAPRTTVVFQGLPTTFVVDPEFCSSDQTALLSLTTVSMGFSDKVNLQNPVNQSVLMFGEHFRPQVDCEGESLTSTFTFDKIDLKAGYQERVVLDLGLNGEDALVIPRRAETFQSIAESKGPDVVTYTDSQGELIPGRLLADSGLCGGERSILETVDGEGTDISDAILLGNVVDPKVNTVLKLDIRNDEITNHSVQIRCVGTKFPLRIPLKDLQGSDFSIFGINTLAKGPLSTTEADLRKYNYKLEKQPGCNPLDSEISVCTVSSSGISKHK